MPMMNNRTFQSSSGLNTITRPSPRRSGGDYLSGQQVCWNKSGLLLMKTDLSRLRSMTWSLQTSLWPRSSRPWGWTTTFGCKPFSIMKNSKGSEDRSQPILTNDSCGESSGWGWSIQRLERRLWMLPLAPWGTPQPLEWGCGRCGERQRVEWVTSISPKLNRLLTSSMQADCLESQMRVQLEIQEGIDLCLEQRDEELRQLRSQSQANGAQLTALSLQLQELSLW